MSGLVLMIVLVAVLTRSVFRYASRKLTSQHRERMNTREFGATIVISCRVRGLPFFLFSRGIEGASDLALMFEYPFDINMDDSFLCDPETSVSLLEAPSVVELPLSFGLQSEKWMSFINGIKSTKQYSKYVEI